MASSFCLGKNIDIIGHKKQACFYCRKYYRDKFKASKTQDEIRAIYRDRMAIQRKKEKHKEYVKEYNKKYAAKKMFYISTKKVKKTIRGFCHAVVENYIRRGILPHPTILRCVDCGNKASEYDHRDYLFPLKIDSVCRSCNIKRGRGLNGNIEKTTTLIKELHSLGRLPRFSINKSIAYANTRPD